MAGEIKRSEGAKPEKNFTSGPFLARVVNHLDSHRMGSLRVELLSFANPSGQEQFPAGQQFTAHYCMPFYGVNDAQSNTRNEQYAGTQQSYGFWAVPPDPGTKVLVMFVENKPNQCFWIGCVQDQYMNSMVPGSNPTSSADLIYQDGLTNDLKGRRLPTGEYNKKQTHKGYDPDRFKRPHNPLFAGALSTQGLLKDPIRGQTTSSARRDTPNTVYGWNTPGPLDKRDGAPKGSYGEKGQSIEFFRSRLGGSSFVMDDGDPSIIRAGQAGNTGAKYYDIEAIPENVSKGDQTIPFNDHVRLRTRTGHQILLHNSEDIIYIGNATGSAWLEMTSNGKIDIYASDSINIRTETDLNITADRDINILAGRDFNLTALRDKKVKVAQNNDVRILQNDTKYVAIDQDLKIGGNRAKAIGIDEDVQIEGTHRTTITGDYNLQVTLDGHIAINQNFHSKVVGDYRQTVNGAFNLNTVGDNKFTSGANTQIKSATDNKLDAGGKTQILSVDVHREQALQIHMNSPAQVPDPSDTSDSIGDTFTKPATNQVVDDDDQVLDKDGVIINDASGSPLRVTADASRAKDAAIALLPRRTPQHEPWNSHESFNPSAHTPGETDSINSPAPEVRTQNSPLTKESDMPERNSTSGVFRAGDAEPESIDTGKIFQNNNDGTKGTQPNDPVNYEESTRFFISELIKGLGLDPAKALNSGATPGGAGEAIAMACANIFAESSFIPKSENMNYNAQGLIDTFKMFKKPGGTALAQQLSRKPVQIASVVYGNRMGNGGPETGDGWTYRGRGLIQLTGTDNYKAYGGMIGVDIYNNPELANDPAVACKLAVAYLTKGEKAGFITWTTTNFTSLGNQFLNAIGYVNSTIKEGRDKGKTKTQVRIESGQSYWLSIKKGELTPLASVTPPTPIAHGGGVMQVQ